MNKYQVRRLKGHWRDLVNGSPYAGRVEDLSEEIGRSSAYLRGMLNNASMPSADVCLALAAKLNCTLSEFFNIGERSPLDPSEIAEAISREVTQRMTDRLGIGEARPTGDDVMEWWHNSNGRLENCDFIEGCFDLFEIPSTDHRHLQPYQLGKRSLASLELGTNSRDVFDRTVKPLDESYRHLILEAHRSSLDRGAFTSIESLDAIHPDTGQKIKISYFRTLAPVQVSGRTLVLNYSKLMGKASKVSGHVSKINAA